MSRLFTAIYDFFSGRRWLAITLMVLMTLLFGFLASKVEFNEDISQFLPQSKEAEKARTLLNMNSNSSQIVIRIGVDADTQTNINREIIIEATDDLAERIEAEMAEYIDSITYTADMEQAMQTALFITENMPYFLTEADYATIEKQINADSIEKRINQDVMALQSAGGEYLSEQISADPLQMALPAIQSLQKFNIAGWRVIDSHLFTSDGKEAIIIITPSNSGSESKNNALMLETLDRVIAETQQAQTQQAQTLKAQTLKADSPKTDALKADALNIHYFSSAAVAITNAERIKKDSIVALTLSLLLIIGLLLWFYRDLRPLIYILPTVAFGGLFSLAIIYLIKGSVSTIAVGAGSIILGIAIDYSIHFITHRKFNGSSRTTIKEVAWPLTIGSFTTIAAFLSLLFMSADAMRDFGLFAAMALIGTLIFVLIFLPHIVKNSSADMRMPYIFDRITSLRPEKRGYAVLFTLLVTILSALFSKHVKFDTNMQHINYMTESQRAELESLKAISGDTLRVNYIASEASEIDEALEANEEICRRLKESGRASDITDICLYLPSKAEQAVRVGRWNRFCKEQRDTLIAMLRASALKSGLTADAFTPFESMLSRTFEPCDVTHFSTLSNGPLKSYITEYEGRSVVLTRLTGEPAEGSFSQSSALETAIATLSHDFDLVLWVSSAIVFIFLLISFRHIELAIIAFLPLCISWIWILGIMSIAGIDFNIVNIVLATFIFGLGDDYAIFMMDGLMQEESYGTHMLQIDKSGVTLSALTLFAGVFTLIIAEHPAMHSLAVITAIGMASVVFVTFTVPPYLYRFLLYKNGIRREVPLTLGRLLRSLYAFLNYVISAIVVVAATSLYFFISRDDAKKRLRLHKVIQHYSRYAINHVPGTTFTLNNQSGEKFEKPAIIICNHQSMLDIVALLMHTPKTIILTNDWVWNSLFFKRIIRYAEFYPVSSGYENILPELRKRVAEGYSIMVFPEGTRTFTGKIGRFHQGAFQMARNLGIDILPMMVHGFFHVLPKSDLLLRKGELYMEIWDRVQTSDATSDPTCRLISRQMHKIYTERYAELCKERETPEYRAKYFKNKYIYQQPEQDIT